MKTKTDFRMFEDVRRSAGPEAYHTPEDVDCRITANVGVIMAAALAAAGSYAFCVGADALRGGGRRSVMNDVLMREIKQSYIPQDVQVAIDTILSYAYTINLENQVLRRRLEDAHRILDDREIDEEIVATHKDIEASESTRIRKIVNETTYAAQEGAGE